MKTNSLLTYQDYLAKHIIGQGYSIYGGYVYKRLVNGDETNDIDVHVKDIEDMNALAKNLKKTFGCKIEDSYWDGSCWDFPPYMIGLKMSCQDNPKYMIDLVTERESSQHSDIFKLEYKKVNNKPSIVYRNGTDQQAEKIIKELKQRRYSPWESMRRKDQLYFSQPKWTNTSLLRFKIKKLLGLIE